MKSLVSISRSICSILFILVDFSWRSLFWASSSRKWTCARSKTQLYTAKNEVTLSSRYLAGLTATMRDELKFRRRASSVRIFCGLMRIIPDIVKVVEKKTARKKAFFAIDSIKLVLRQMQESLFLSRSSTWHQV